MAKGYWIVHVKITNPERYKDYVAANGAALTKYKGRFLVRAGQSTVPYGSLGEHRHVVIEFPDYATALACHRSPEYQAAEKIRNEASTSDFIIVEGYDG